MGAAAHKTAASKRTTKKATSGKRGATAKKAAAAKKVESKPEPSTREQLAGWIGRWVKVTRIDKTEVIGRVQFVNEGVVTLVVQNGNPPSAPDGRGIEAIAHAEIAAAEITRKPRPVPATV